MQADPPLHVAHDAVSVAGARRTFTTLSGAGSGPGGLVVVLHGSKQTGDGHRRFTGDALAPLAAHGDAVVAYLDGYRGNWNDARRESFFPARTQGVDDVGFVRAVVGRLTATHDVDPSRVVLVGYSNGGQMVLRLLHEAPDLVDAAVIVAATMPAPENMLELPSTPESRPVPVALVHGTRDRIVPFEGGTMPRWAEAVFKVGGRMRSARDTAAYLAHRNGITAPPRITVLATAAGAGRGTSVVRIRSAQGEVPPVDLYEVRGGGHTIPGVRPAPRILGRTGGDVALIDLVRDALREIDRR